MEFCAANGLVVHKFGGSSLADADCFRRVAAIVESEPAPRLALVLSACRGVTDELVAITALAEASDRAACDARVAALAARHRELAQSLLAGAALDEVAAALDADLADLRQLLQAIALLRSAGGDARDRIAGFGELWSTRLFAALLAARGRRRGIRYVDARELIVVEWGALGPRVQWDASRARSARLASDAAATTCVLPGFVATDTRGLQTTLGRNGSDYSASILAALLGASEVVIWTDVDGVLSADPRLVPEAQVIGALSYDEAMELAYFGAKVLHPQTMAPAVGQGIPIRIRNTFAPDHPGTRITGSADAAAVKGVTSIGSIALVNLEGAGMIGVPGTASRLFAALNDAGISVTLISQGSSEHSICCAVPATQAQAAARALERAFAAELRDGQIQSVAVASDCAILAVVGDGMAGSPGISGKLFGALGTAGVNVRAIAQGASERNISVVVAGSDAPKALRAVHSRFYLSPHTLSVGLVGPGTVGGALLAQLGSQAERFRRQFKLDLRVRGIASSKRMLLADGEIALGSWRERLAADGTPADLDRFAAHVGASHLPHRVIIDCTADAGIAGRYADWFAAGLHVVTPNKKAGSAPLAVHGALQAARRAAGRHFLYEATVGAGLPIITTLRDLRETGDRVQAVEGMLSGTLAYLFNVFDGSTPFSAIVAEARRQGFTEPDPRDDLSGKDVARKLVILGREMGLALELGSVEVESLVPAELRDCTVDEFMSRLPAHDGRMAERLARARSAGRLLRYVGRLTADGHATVAVEEVDARHAFAHVALTDNVVRFVTDRYRENPLVVQGPGAGPEVTAGGVFADLLRLASYLGARI